MISVVLGLNSCKPEVSTPETSTLTISLTHLVDSNDLVSNDLIHKNAAGYMYSVSRLEYYLSNFILINKAGQEHRIHATQYINFRDSATHSFTLEHLELNSYTQIQFNFGLRPSENISNSLPNTAENVGMAWPEPMGGGYHFMKFEGKYRDTSKLKGFAIHLGTNVCELAVELPITITIDQEENRLEIEMNVNEWMTNPHDYDFEVHGYYTMGDTALMQMVRDNGKTAFKIINK